MRYSVGSSGSFQGYGNPLPYSNAHRTKSATLACKAQLQCSRACNPCPAHTERMAKSNRAAIGVDVRTVFWKPKFPEHCYALASESLVEFHMIEFGRFQA
jgi:hypothetical protein